ncbi:TrpB-like pyridoxal phosphate-dependent enzyme [Herbivorax sp. ANBcel31]|uniref:TrpB-like pyridoxal phosphate-dependent enzyme n=1 Tax=Herbivorax sp. ANBcel31 TaxID=3069754 RepID=UPI0027AF3008|nr:TrpB-like pyridoxal phosphate-dependent enzyme [Herbivorax sp. ANBcel31]MDQ2085490.1 TrpB-like pyridoxal phosphate-dependent enzyme [Herbivorax sp. ANBcel31]
MSKKDVRKVILEENEIPKKWYNILADMPNKPDPYVSSMTNKIATPDELQAIFPKELIKQENSSERWIDIPDEVREMYRQWRPSPLYRAEGLEKLLDTPARIYYKYEGINATGSHKLNTAIPQAYYNKMAGIKKLSTETGAGQWGSALSLACNHFDLDCSVYMVKVSYQQKPYRRSFMQTFGADVIPSPSNLTKCGRTILEKDPDSTGSLGMAISEAVEVAATNDDTNYALGSVLNHVALHQTVIGLESKKQLETLDEYPDVVYACCGGGSNFAGIAFPFISDKLNGTNIRLVAVEPTACPTLTKGVFAYDYGDTGKVGPIAKMYTLGHDFVPAGIHAGGLRYHGQSPIVSQLYHDGIIEAQAVAQKEIFEAALQFAQTEGIIPAPESAHAIRGTINEALKCKESGESKVILFSLSGHGYFDMAAYDNYLRGKLVDVDYSDDSIKESMKNLPDIK